MDKSPDAFRTISEAADELDLPQHVLRFWETRFSTTSPVLGLRPIRWFFERTWNEPKDESFTFCPETSASPMSVRKRSTSSADSVRDSPTDS